MGEFRRIKTSLFLLLLLQFAAAAGRLFTSSTVTVGADVTVSCGKLIGGQHNCDGTTWTFAGSRTSSEVRLVSLGRISREAKSKSARLSVTVDCSLVIENVTAEDAGLYDCQQFNRSGRKKGPVGQVLLSVVTMTEMKNADETTLNCSVSIYDRCTHTVEWLHQSPGVKTSQSPCCATLTFLPSRLVNMSSFYSFMCEVTDGHSRAKQRFPFSLRSSAEKPGEETTTTTEPTGTTENSEAAGTTTRTSPIESASTEPQAPTGCSAVNYIMLVLRVAELLLITVITVLLIRAPGNHRPPDDNTLSNSVRRPPLRRSGAAASQVNDDEDEDDGVVKYENFGDSSGSVRLR